MKHHAIFEGETMRSFITGNFSIVVRNIKRHFHLETDLYKLELAV